MLEIHFARIEASPSGGDDVTLVPLTAAMRVLEYVPVGAPINVTRTPGRRVGARPVSSTVDNVTESLTVRVNGSVPEAQRTLNQVFTLALEWSKQFRRDMRFVVRIRDPQRHQAWFEAEVFGGRVEMADGVGRVLRVTWEREPYWSGAEQILTLRNSVSGVYIFPSTPVLDDFNRAGPALGANWLKASWSDPMAIESNMAKMVDPVIDIGDYTLFWHTRTPADCEAYFTIGDLNGFNGGVEYVLCARMADFEEFATTYFLDVEIANSAQISIAIKKIVATAQSTLASYTEARPIAAGDSFGLSCVGSALVAWYKPAGGTWIKWLDVVDTSINAGGYIGLEIYCNDSQNARTAIDNFGGGARVEELRYTLGITNCDDDRYGNDNFVIVDAPGGDVPTPARIKIRNTYATNPATRLKEVRIGWYDRPHYLTLEGEASESSIVTIDSDAKYSGLARATAQNYQWTLAQSNIVDFVGLFRVLANGDLSGGTWSLSTGYELTRLQTAKAVAGQSGWTDLGLISLPPGGYVHPFRYPVRIWMDGSASGHLDYLMFMPIQQWRHVRFDRGYNCAVGACIVDDGIRDELIYDFNGKALPILAGWGDPIELWPAGTLPGNQQQMLVFAMTNDFDRAEPLRTADVQVTVRPRYNVVP